MEVPDSFPSQMKTAQPYLVNVFTDVGSPKISFSGDETLSPDSQPAKDQQLQKPQVQGHAASVAPPLTPVPVGQRVFCDPGINLERGQSWFGEAFALISMALYMSIPHILLMLVVASFFSKAALWICVGELVLGSVRPSKVC